MLDAEKFMVTALRAALKPESIPVGLGRPAKSANAAPGPSVSVDVVGGNPHESNPNMEWLTVSIDIWAGERPEAITLAGAVADLVVNLKARPDVAVSTLMSRPAHYPDPDRAATRYTLSARLLVRVDAQVEEVTP